MLLVRCKSLHEWVAPIGDKPTICYCQQHSARPIQRRTIHVSLYLNVAHVFFRQNLFQDTQLVIFPTPLRHLNHTTGHKISLFSFPVHVLVKSSSQPSRTGGCILHHSYKTPQLSVIHYEPGR
jgi:hypothetical protein